MTISEMHVWFRQYAQQMGMQNVRAILPEQIDNLINTAIKDTIDEVINKNIGTTNDRVITDNAKLASINALRTLYRVKTIFNIDPDHTIKHYLKKPYIISSDYILDDVLYYVDFSINYTEPLDDPSDLNMDNALWINWPYKSAYKKALTVYSDLLDDLREGVIENRYKGDETTPIVGIKTTKEAIRAMETGMTTQSTVMNTTRWFPIRIIDDTYLADVLNDWVLSPRLRTPVMVIYSENSNISTNGDTSFDIYLGENDSENLKNIVDNKYIGQIRCSYIKKPKEVHYLSDVGGDNVDSDLPEQLQIPMLKHAVDLYRISIQGSLYANQQNTQQNQQEIARNNARPDNEGYQS